MSVRLGEILVKEALITQDHLTKALEFQRSNGGKLGSCLTKMGYITDDDITGVLSPSNDVLLVQVIAGLIVVASWVGIVVRSPRRQQQRSMDHATQS